METTVIFVLEGAANRRDRRELWKEDLEKRLEGQGGGLH